MGLFSAAGRQAGIELGKSINKKKSKKKLQTTGSGKSVKRGANVNWGGSRGVASGASASRDIIANRHTRVKKTSESELEDGRKSRRKQ